ncbi:MAG: type II toxin-antitoxin system HipA family toxin [Anaerolineaceae bacterium]|nr:type II toxin-antitoxin system HipA family toxin [Anaerolineaceae bacterium]
MTDKLIAYKANKRVGVLSRDGDSYFFCYDVAWLEQEKPSPLSHSLPLQEEPFTSKETKPFFSNLLPEGQFRDHIASKHRVSAEDDFALLAALAGDCAGAIALHPEDVSPPSPENHHEYHLLSKEDKEKLFDEAFIMDLTFLGPKEATRLSLAGVQDKLPIMIKDGELHIPLHGAPSTHILKPQHAKWGDLVENEAFCMALAKEMELNVPETFILNENDRAYIVERYDRLVDEEGRVTRIHQEDFCQALGYSYREKYEESGGPGHKECFNLVKIFKNPLQDKIRLISLAVFNVLICNYDCHGKNISLFYKDGVAPSLAPHYDLVCAGVYNLPSSLAMSIGGILNPRDLSLEAWTQFAKDIGDGSPKPVINTIQKMAGKIPEAARKVAGEMVEKYGDNDIYEKILDQITNRAEISLRQIKN